MVFFAIQDLLYLNYDRYYRLLIYYPLKIIKNYWNDLQEYVHQIKLIPTFSLFVSSAAIYISRTLAINNEKLNVNTIPLVFSVSDH